MIDKLDLQIPKDAVSGPLLNQALSWDPTKPKFARVHPEKHYEGMIPLKPVGLDAILHYRSRHGEHHSKLEILDVGKKAYSDMEEIVRQVTPASPDRLRIMRLDLTADLWDIPVIWFKEHARFKFKRTGREYGEIKYGLVGSGDVETIYAGSRPNLFRIYNKVKEHLYQFRSMQRAVSADADVLEFTKEFGVKETDVLTRVERQCGGRGIPRDFSTFGSIRGLADFNPFTAIEIIKSDSKGLPSPQDCEGLEYYTGLGLQCEALRISMQGLRRQLNSQTMGNAARTMQRYSRFFPDRDGRSITIEQIVEAYRRSTVEQLAA